MPAAWLKPFMPSHGEEFAYWYRNFYLRTGWWMYLSQLVRETRINCELCSNWDREMNVHHLTYDRLGEERQTDLLLLCAECHVQVEYSDRPLAVDFKSPMGQILRGKYLECVETA